MRMSTDVWGDDKDLDPYFSETSGRFGIGQRVIRRLVTSRGTHPSDDDYGTDVRSWLGSNFTHDEINVRETAIEIEAEKELGVLEAHATIKLGDNTRFSCEFRVEVYLVTTEGEFTVELNVGSSPAGGGSSENVMTTNNYNSVVVDLTDEPQMVMAARSGRTRLKIQNDNPVDVYRAFGRATTTDSLIIGKRNEEELANPAPGSSVWLMCRAGEIARVLVEEFY